MNCVTNNNTAGLRIRANAGIRQIYAGKGTCIVMGRGARGPAGADGQSFPGPYFDDAAAAADGVNLGSGYYLDYPNAYDLPNGTAKIRTE